MRIACVKSIARMVSPSSSSLSHLSSGSASGNANGDFRHWHRAKRQSPRLPINDWVMSGEPIMAQEYLSVAEFCYG